MTKRKPFKTRRPICRRESIRGDAWKVIRIRRVFTLQDIADAVEADTRVVGLYIRSLCKTGVLRQTIKRRGREIGVFNTYRIAKDLGPIAPQVCADGRSYDPNGKKFIELLKEGA
ncbi:hypothetical protein [Ferrovibrio terrae]|uniref:hypothetical protein n=1 Tax=Ferrovibrio terrae TaxID=2594003 RepID=UPI003138053A